MKSLALRISIFLTVITALGQVCSAEDLVTISFNLYTDSLKKGFYNYISVDGKYEDGRWMPLDSTQVKFTANTGFFKGNDIFIDSSYTGDSIIVKAVLRDNPRIWKEVVIYIRKRGFDEPLKTNDEIFEEIRSNNRKKKNERSA